MELKSKLTVFILRNCPFCKRALQYITELKKENPEFKNIKLDIIDEEERKELADSYDYYYVPTFYMGKEKLHEGAIYKKEVSALLQRVLLRALIDYDSSKLAEMKK
jgi:glutaredoxin